MEKKFYKRIDHEWTRVCSCASVKDYELLMLRIMNYLWIVRNDKIFENIVSDPC